MAVLFAMIIIGLIPLTISLCVNVGAGRKVAIEIHVGSLVLRPKIGQGEANATFIKGLTKHIKPPVPIHKLPKYVAGMIEISDIMLRLRVGTDDAAQTAVVSGMFETLLRTACVWLYAQNNSIHNRTGHSVHVNVAPVFGKPAFELRAAIEIQGTIGHYVNVALRLALMSLVRTVRAARHRPTVTVAG